MPTPNPFPLLIPQKVNSPELLAWFQQFGIDKYLSAEEINKLRDGLNFLYENNINANQNNTWREVFLGFFDGTRLSRNALFNQELIVSETENIMLVFVDNSIPSKTYRYKFAAGKGTYNPIPKEEGIDIIIESVSVNLPSIPVIIAGANTVTFNLGDISETPLYEFVNTNGEYDMEDEDKTFLFLFNRGDVAYLYQFVGDLGVYGDGFLNSEPVDFNYITSSEVEPAIPINQDNIPKKVTYTFAQLDLDPLTATQEEIIEAVKVANAGDEVAEDELRYIEIIDYEESAPPLTCNFDVTNNWGALGVTGEANFRTNVLDFYGFSSYTITDFEMIDDRIRCNITEITGNPVFFLDVLTPGCIIHNFSLQNIDGLIMNYAHTTTLENLELFEGSRYLMLSYLTNTVFNFNIPSTSTEVVITNSNLKNFSSPLLGQSLTYIDLRYNQFTISDYEAMEAWASSLDDRLVYHSLAIDFSDNPDNPIGTTFATILETKGIQVIYE